MTLVRRSETCGDEVFETETEQLLPAVGKQSLRRFVGKSDGAVRTHQQHGVRRRVEEPPRKGGLVRLRRNGGCERERAVGKQWVQGPHGLSFHLRPHSSLKGYVSALSRGENFPFFL